MSDEFAMVILGETAEVFRLHEEINAAMQRIAKMHTEQFSLDHIHVARMRLRLADLKREHERKRRHGSKLD